ncbi:MAG: LytTR family transcriptional regulator [Lachnospiraceae bacterium]|nr:LytTR family transcriptional regulator [Lachnospiraceae bacterium]MDD7027141.1 LytTR family DNA-binding domain-containing protein [Lachnospiraceae bacterium]MDY5700148.1 LytTR family DNA-binding domain-containing protein [Lachnospiraceae bacterium]
MQKKDSRGKDQTIQGKEDMVTYSFVEGKLSLPVNNIIYIETYRHKNLFHTRTNTYSLYRKLNEIEEDLKDKGFLRTHLSYLVNMHYIEKISSYVLTLSDGKELSVPKARYKAVKQRYNQFLER